MYIVKYGSRMEIYGTPVCISLDVDITPMTKIEFSPRKERSNKFY
jgi:hypothetical protein